MLFRYLDGLLHSQTVQGLLRSSGGRGQKNKEQAAARSIFLTTPWDDRQAGQPENPGGGERAQISLMTEDRNEVYTGRRGGGVHSRRRLLTMKKVLDRSGRRGGGDPTSLASVQLVQVKSIFG
jgi:hypothetical protein